MLKKALHKANKESLKDYPTILAQTQQQWALQEKTLRTLRKEQEALIVLIACAEEEKIALFALWLPTAFTQKTYVHLAKLPLDNPEIQEALREARIAPSKPYLCLFIENNNTVIRESNTLFHILLSIAKNDIHHSFLEVVHLFLDRRANLWKCNNKYETPKADVDTLHTFLTHTPFTTLMGLALQEDALYSEKVPSLLRKNARWKPIIRACETLKTKLEALIPIAQRTETRLQCKEAYNELIWLAPTMDFFLLLNKAEEICNALKKEIYWFNPRSSLVVLVAAIESFAEKIKLYIGNADEQKVLLDIKHALLQERALLVPPSPFSLLSESAQQKEIILMQSQEIQQWRTLYKVLEKEAEEANTRAVKAEEIAEQERKRAEEANNNTEKTNKKVEALKNKVQEAHRRIHYAQEETQQYKQKLQESVEHNHIILQKNVALTQENTVLTDKLQKKKMELVTKTQEAEEDRTEMNNKINLLQDENQQSQTEAREAKEMVMELHTQIAIWMNGSPLPFFSSPSEEKSDTTSSYEASPF